MNLARTNAENSNEKHLEHRLFFKNVSLHNRLLHAIDAKSFGFRVILSLRCLKFKQNQTKTNII